MTLILLDTNIVSYSFKGDSRAIEYAPLIQGNQLAVSFVTVAELYEWTAVRKWGNTRIAQLEANLKNYLIIQANKEICQVWGNLRAECRASGIAISPNDAWIAATALHYQLTLVTHNPKDFQNIPHLKIQTILGNQL